jgi:hypothetical protein
MAVQAELVGPGIQSNRLKLSQIRLFVFDIWRERQKLWYDLWPAELKKLSVPQLGKEWLLKPTLEESLAMVDGLAGNITPGCLDEGIVYHIVDYGSNREGVGSISLRLADAIGGSMNFKIINREYLARNGE